MKWQLNPYWILIGILCAAVAWGWAGVAYSIAAFMVFFYCLIPITMMLVQRLSIHKDTVRVKQYRELLGEAIPLLHADSIEHLKHNGPNLARSMTKVMDRHDFEDHRA